jgi:hypothetical protein
MSRGWPQWGFAERPIRSKNADLGISKPNSADEIGTAANLQGREYAWS